jgi:hypothetical protein
METLNCPFLVAFLPSPVGFENKSAATFKDSSARVRRTNVLLQLPLAVHDVTDNGNCSLMAVPMKSFVAPLMMQPSFFTWPEVCHCIKARLNLETCCTIKAKDTVLENWFHSRFRQ